MPRRATPPSRSTSPTRNCRRSSTSTAADKPGAAQVWPEAENNTCFDWAYRRQGGGRCGLRQGAHVDQARPHQPAPGPQRDGAARGDRRFRPRHRRVHALHHQPEPACHPPADGRLRAADSGIKLRVVAPDVGGGFGSKIFHYAEEALVTWAAGKVEPSGQVDLRPRRKPSSSDAHGRDHVSHAELALDKDGKFLGLPGHHHRQHGRLSLDLRALRADLSLRPRCWRASSRRRRSMPR